MNTETCFKKKLYTCMKEKIMVHFQKQPSEVFCKKKIKRYSYRFHKFHRKTPVLKSLFDKAAFLSKTGSNTSVFP